MEHVTVQSKKKVSPTYADAEQLPLSSCVELGTPIQLLAYLQNQIVRADIRTLQPTQRLRVEKLPMSDQQVHDIRTVHQELV